MNNYHTHTFRCGHGAGQEEDMVLAARSMGMQELGFSEHVPLPCYRLFMLKSAFHCRYDFHAFLSLIKAMLLNGQGMRMPFSMKKTHEKIVRELKRKYQRDITIYLGYECEYFPGYIPYYQKMLKNKTIDYLILGNHFDQYPLHQYYYGKNKLSDKMLRDYRDHVIAAMETGLFSYIAHPDLFLMGRDHFDELCQEVTYDICLAAKRMNIPLELNAGGIRKGMVEKDGRMVFPYASDYFFEIAGKVENDIILGIDAHHPDHFDQDVIEQLYHIVHRHHLHIIDKIEMKGI